MNQIITQWLLFSFQLLNLASDCFRHMLTNHKLIDWIDWNWFKKCLNRLCCWLGFYWCKQWSVLGFFFKKASGFGPFKTKDRHSVAISLLGSWKCTDRARQKTRYSTEVNASLQKSSKPLPQMLVHNRYVPVPNDVLRALQVFCFQQC